MPLQIDNEYVSEVLQRLRSSPTAQDLDYLVAAYTTIGWYAGELQGTADLAESERKYAQAEAYTEGKGSIEKATQAQLESFAVIKTRDHSRAEVRANRNALQMKNLWLSIEQAINAIKFLHRNDSFGGGNGVRMG